jgi:arabinan endo-1,5-alpha-L-arabinosidase
MKKYSWKKFSLLIPLIYLLISCTDISTSLSELPVESSKQLTRTNYINPVYNSRFADPGIIEVDEKYYAFATEGNYISSVDLVNWEMEGNVLMYTGSPLWGSNGANVWAPTVNKIQDKYIFYYALSAWGDSNPGIGYNYIEDITDFNWEPGKKLFTSNEIGVSNSIDPFVIEEDGHVYMVWGSFNGIYLVELTSDGMDLLGGLTNAYENKIRIAGNFEGAWIQKRDDYFYLYLSQGSCCNGLGSNYNVVVFRSLSLFGPYYDKNGNNALFGGGTTVLHSSEYFIGPGHNSVITDANNDDWIVYHSYSVDSPNARVLCIDLLVYEDGWPKVLNNVPSNYLTQGPTVRI